MPQDKARELAHARKILHNPAFYWNAGTRAGETGSRRRADWVIRAASLAPGRRALEVGCGTGFFSERFIAAGAELHAIDISPELLAKAVERCGQSRARFRLCDIERVPYPDDYFDAVVGIRVLHHLDLAASFREIIRTLKPGGVIAFCEPNMLNPQIFIQKNVPAIKRWMGDTPDETAFLKWRLKRFLAGRGFAGIEIEPFDFLHPWVPPFLVRGVESLGGFMEKVPLVREIAGSLSIRAHKRSGRE